MYDASNRKDIRRAEKASRQAELDRINYLAAAMSTWQGRAWFYKLIEDCHIFQEPFTGDPIREAFLKGERNVGLRLFSDIMTHCPDEYVTMMREENGRRAERDTANNRASDPASAGEQLGREELGRDVEGSIIDPADEFSDADQA